MKPLAPECLDVAGCFLEKGLRPYHLRCRRTVAPEWGGGGGGACMQHRNPVLLFAKCSGGLVWGLCGEGAVWRATQNWNQRVWGKATRLAWTCARREANGQGFRGRTLGFRPFGPRRQENGCGGVMGRGALFRGDWADVALTHVCCRLEPGSGPLVGK